FGGGYRYAINSLGRRTVSVLECVEVCPPLSKDPHPYGGPPPPPPPPKIECKPRTIELAKGSGMDFSRSYQLELAMVALRRRCQPAYLMLPRPSSPEAAE